MKYEILVSGIAASRLWYQVLGTSIPDTRGAQSAPIPAREAGASERDSSGTTERMTRSGRREGDGADSPTRAGKACEAARPKTYFIIRPQKVGWRLAR